MTGALDELLDVHAAVLEVAAAQALDRLEQRRELLRRVAARCRPSAAAGGALDHHRVADALGLARRGGDVLEQRAARQQRNATRLGGFARVLQAELAQMLGARTDEANALGGEALGERGVLAESRSRDAPLRRRWRGRRRRCGRCRGSSARPAAAIATAASAIVTCRAWRSASEYTAAQRAHAFERPKDAAGNSAAIGDETVGREQAEASVASVVKFRRRR